MEQLSLPDLIGKQVVISRGLTPEEHRVNVGQVVRVTMTIDARTVPHIFLSNRHSGIPVHEETWIDILD